MRFNRDYELTIAISDTQAIIIKPPLNIVFDCLKTTKSSLNKLDLRLFNLNESRRLELTKEKGSKRRIPIVLKVGYEGRLEVIFKGDINVSSTERNGTDFITNIECFDGGHDYLNAFTSRTVKGKDAAIEAILRDMTSTTKGKITQLKELLRPKVLVGSSSKLIEEMLEPDEEFFIDNEQLFIMKENEVNGSYAPLISAQTGLINTPEREDDIIYFNSMMNPTIALGGFCNVDSKTAPNLNGVYKVQAINYSGEYEGQDWVQSVQAKLMANYKVL